MAGELNYKLYTIYDVLYTYFWPNFYVLWQWNIFRRKSFGPKKYKNKKLYISKNVPYT